jgi:hypothetical protein
MSGSKSEKEKWLNCILQPFASQFIDKIPSVQLFAANNLHVFFSLKPL